jgi:hypothetical protein
MALDPSRRSARAVGLDEHVDAALHDGVDLGVAQRDLTEQNELTDGKTSNTPLSDTFATSFWWVFGFTALTLLPALLLPRAVPAPSTDTPVEAPAAA